MATSQNRMSMRIAALYAQAIVCASVLMLVACSSGLPSRAGSNAPPDPPTAVAAAPASPMVPSAPHEALAFFEGTWTTVGMPPEREYRERCGWMEGGRRHMVCHTRLRATDGKWRESYSIFSYRPSDSTYLYHGIRSGGAIETLSGQRTENGWQFWSDVDSDVARRRTRVTITQRPERGFRLVAETASGDGAWQLAGAPVEYILLSEAP